MVTGGIEKNYGEVSQCRDQFLIDSPRSMLWSPDSTVPQSAPHLLSGDGGAIWKKMRIPIFFLHPQKFFFIKASYGHPLKKEITGLHNSRKVGGH